VTGERFALVAGGGTAGHLQPALAIAEALVAAGHPRDTIEFVGSERGQDRATLDGRGFPSTLLPGRGIVRRVSPRALVDNLGAVAGLGVALVRGLGVVRRTRPRVVVSVGGYASLPASVAAVVYRAMSPPSGRSGWVAAAIWRQAARTCSLVRSLRTGRPSAANGSVLTGRLRAR